ncbi:uncharacterized protein FIBRA_01509 [Fibroporia radiculosa]|uniref:Rhodopsin domain-containing protein n=1 Tax=Fibroporia radiculosa TaxID=599839 RepID=J4I8I9_9APHY|nr:uncharacterized protein FIBRA_01509 [Fibroporia radiculosa]CCL99491.1 predicted protein [Fibroporia radiculosa]
MSTEAAVPHLEQTLRIVNFVLPTTSICLTIIRLYDRAATRRLWWDDAWAAFTMVLSLVFMVIVELFVQYHIEAPDKFPQDVKISIYYMYFPLLFFNCKLIDNNVAGVINSFTWLLDRCLLKYYRSARISILFTIIRLTVPGRLRKGLILSACAFGLTWAILFAQVWWVCEKEPGWKESPTPQCDLGRNVAIAQVIADVLGDSILIVAPIRLVWGIKLTRPQKIRVIAVFSSTSLTTAVSLNHASWVLRDGGLIEALASVIQTSVSLIVVNLNVLVALIFRISSDDHGGNVTPLDMKSILTFGHGRSRKQGPNVNILTTTFVLTDCETALGTSVALDTFVDRGYKTDGPGHSNTELQFPASGDVKVMTGTDTMDTMHVELTDNKRSCDM